MYGTCMVGGVIEARNACMEVGGEAGRRAGKKLP